MEPQTFLCQQCKARIVITASDGDPPLPAASSQPTRLEESFMMLEDTVYGPHRTDGPAGGVVPRHMEESFVVLPPGPGPRGGDGGLRGPGGGPTASSAAPRVPFYDTLCALRNVLELASGASGVDHPLCTDCAADVHRELDAQTADLQAELAAYEAALAELERGGGEAGMPAGAGTVGTTPSISVGRAPPPTTAPPAVAAQRNEELAAARREVERAAAELREAEAEAAAAEASLARLRGVARELDAAEREYWHELNGVQRATAAHVALRDGLAARLEAGAAALDTLRRTSVLSASWRIWFQGPFGTIGGLRLGRTAAQPVPWDEINAAWGAAVALLDTLIRVTGAKLPGPRLVPMGSYSRIADGHATYELYGPVNKLLCPSYDRAQVGFLACLREFADWLARRGCTLALPWAIEGDRVGALSIRYALAKDRNWTKALKYMLVDLKFCMKAVIELQMDRAEMGGGVGPTTVAAGGGGGAGPVAAQQQQQQSSVAPGRRTNAG